MSCRYCLMRRMAAALHAHQAYAACVRSLGAVGEPGVGRSASTSTIYTSLGSYYNPFETGQSALTKMVGGTQGGQPDVMAGGGPRTFPGGVSKWQWKRMQEKKQKENEKKALMHEREVFEAKRREQLRLLNGVERPWDDVKRPDKDLSPIQLARAVPEAVLARHVKTNAAEDLWNDRDGPISFTRSDGPLPIHSTQSRQQYQSRGGNAEASSARSGSWAAPKRARPNLARPDGVLGRGDEQRRRVTTSAVRGRPTGQTMEVADQTEAGPTAGPSAGPSAGTGTGGSGADPTFMSETRFDSFPLAPESLRAVIEGFGYQTCTRVQAATLPPILAGKDVIAKAKTGSGKTIAFLLPAIEKIVGGKGRGPSTRTPTPIHVLAITPARELAAQVAVEGVQLLQFHQGLGAQKVIGGINMSSEAGRLNRLPCHILVGTPGRLLDHIQSTPGIRDRLQSLQVLILDECDQLLQMGFRKTLEGILQALPRQRQTLLFSATMPKEVMDMAGVALKGDHLYVDTVGEDSGETNTQVSQEVVVAPLQDQMGVLHAVLKEHMKEESDYKVLVFATTARQTQLLAEVFRAMGVNALEIHSRKSQSQRTKTSDLFRNSPGRVVMFTSDVSARGVDYPNVSLVLQVGIPSGREQYVHRLGRTGRGGREGKGMLVLAPWEDHFLRSVKDLPIVAKKAPQPDAKTLREVEAGLGQVSEDTKGKAYQAWLGYYKGVKGIKWDNVGLVKEANRFSAIMGLREPPVLLKKTVGMMGLRGTPGLKVQ